MIDTQAIRTPTRFCMGWMDQGLQMKFEASSSQAYMATCEVTAPKSIFVLATVRWTDEVWIGCVFHS